MTKDVLITIRGVHTMDEEDNDVEMIVRGDYYQKNGKHYVLYEELLEGFKEPVKNIIRSRQPLWILQKREQPLPTCCLKRTGRIFPATAPL